MAHCQTAPTHYQNQCWLFIRGVLWHSHNDNSMGNNEHFKPWYDMFVTLYSVTYYIYVSGKPWICFHYYCAVYDECKYWNTIWLADCTHLFVQYTISLSSLCKLIWRHWICKMPVRYILLSVWVRLSIFSPLSIIRYVGLYVFSLPISLAMIERIHIRCLIIIIKSEV